MIISTLINRLNKEKLSVENPSITLQISDDLPSSARDWLSAFYSFSTQSPWLLSLKGGLFNLSNTDKQLSLCVDFSQFSYQNRRSSKTKEVLLEAVKIKKKRPNYLIDATPGVLKDSLMLSNHGIKVTAIERNPLLFLMVNHALSYCENNINYQFGDAIDQLPELADLADVIYLDPMFPIKKKSARVKQDMQILHDIVGKDTDAIQLLDTALNHHNRVVVKRPNEAPPFANFVPSHNLLSGKKMIRYDVYVGHKMLTEQ